MTSHLSSRTIVTMSVLLPFVAGCGGGDSPTDHGNGGNGAGNGGNGAGNGGNGVGNGGGQPVATTSVDVLDNLTFNPNSIIVSSGATVTWTWQGGEVHTVTWVSAVAGLPNSPDQATGTHEVTMPTAAGQFDYYCALHGSPTSGMRGTVQVQ